jgi:Sap-like sulfolipid-1-addressing protein
VLGLAIAIVAIALPDCINPSLIGGELLFVPGQHPARQTATFALAAFAVTFLVGLALALGLGDLLLSVLPKPGATVKYALITAAGIVLLSGSAVVWVRRGTLTSAGSSDRHRPAAGSAALAGGGIAGLELLTAFPYFAAIALIVGSSVSDPGKIFLLVLYCVVYTAPLVGIAGVCALRRERAQAGLRRVIQWLFTRWPVIVAPIAGIVGTGLTVYGIVKLT